MIQSPRRSSATVGALMVGLMFVFSTGAYIQSYKQMIDRWTHRMLNADLVVATSALLRSTSYHFSEDMGHRIAALPEVNSVENIRFTFIPYRGDTVALNSNEMDIFLARAPDAIEDANAKDIRDRLSRGEGALISRNFSARWKCRVGDHVQLNSPTGVLNLPVLGIVEDYRSDKGSIFIDRALYKKYWKDDAVDFVNVNLKPGEDPAKVKREIEQLTAGTDHALVYTNAEFRDWIGSLVDQFFLLNYMQLVVAVIVAVVGIVNTLIVSVMDRRREFAIVRAIGGYRSPDSKDGAARSCCNFNRGCYGGCVGGGLQYTILVAHGINGFGGLRCAFLLSLGARSWDSTGSGRGIVARGMDSSAPCNANPGNRGNRL